MNIAKLAALALVSLTLNAQNVISTIAGNGTAGFSGDGITAIVGSLNTPASIVTTSGGRIYICDSTNSVVLRIIGGFFSVVAGTGTAGFSGDGGPARSATLNHPAGIAYDDTDGTIYISDTGNQRIRMVKPDGTIVTIAGTGTVGFSGDNGPAASAQVDAPNGLILEATNSTAENFTTVGSTRLFVVDAGNNRIRVIDLKTGIIKTLAGGSATGAADGIPGSFNIPVGIAHSPGLNLLYVSDTNNNRIRTVDLSTGRVSTIAGSTAGFGGDGGPASAALFNSPRNIVLDPGENLYIADYANNRIRKLDSGGKISTVAGTGTAGFSGDNGSPTAAQLNGPRSVGRAAGNYLYIADSLNHRVRLVQPQIIPITVSPTSITLATAAGTTSAAQTFKVTNTGTSGLNMGAITASPATGIAISSGTCASALLQPGDSCTFSFTFSPTAAGNYSSAITVANNAGNLTIPLTLTGLAPTTPVMVLSPTSLSFSTAVGSSATQSIRISNDGGAALNISNITAISGSNITLNLSSCLGGAIQPGNSCTLGVTYSPSTTGKFSSALTVTSNATPAPVSIPLDLTALAANAPIISLSTSSLSFSAGAGTRSAPQTVTISNTGGVALNISNIKASDSALILDLTSCLGSPVQPGNSCNFSVVFSPLAAGSFSYSITITSNAATSPTVVSVSATAGTPGFSISPSSFSFGPLVVGTSTGPKPATITNTGTADLSIQTFLLPDKTNFSTDTAKCPSVLAAGASCTMTVEFHPAAAASGVATAITFTSNAATNPRITLTGDGILKTTTLPGGSIVTNCADSDGDGLCDDWESKGVYMWVNGADQFVDLPSMGADPRKKDIFVHVDWTSAAGSGKVAQHNHAFDPEAARILVDSFAAAPVDSGAGIAIHIDCGPNCPMKPGAVWGKLSLATDLAPNNEPATMMTAPASSGANSPDPWVLFDKLSTTFNNTGRALIFHHVIASHQQYTGFFSSGLSANTTTIEAGASKLMMTLGGGENFKGSVQQQAGTLMHELGHNLGLHHGGNDEFNYKPNYLSIMNYSFQMSGLHKDGGSGVYDYSRFELPQLDETKLLELNGLNAGPAFPKMGTSWFCPGAALSDNKGTPNKTIEDARSGIDWQCKGLTTKPVSVDISGEPDTNGNPYLGILAKSQFDWTKLVYSGGSISGRGIDVDVPAPATREISPQEGDAIPVLTQVRLSYPSLISVKPGSSTTIAIVATNRGMKADSYAPSLTSDSGITVDGSALPPNFSLLAGTSNNLIVTVAVPGSAAPGDSYQLQLKVQSQNYAGTLDAATVTVQVSNTPAPLAFSTGSFDFGQQAQGLPSFAKTLVLSNTGGAAIAIPSITITGDFSQTNNCGTSLAAGVSCVIQVVFLPTAAGTRTGVLTVNDNVPGGPHVINLSGVAGAPGPSIAAAVNAASSQPGGVAPGSLFTLYGSQLGGTAEIATALPLPTLLGGVTMTIGGIPVPLLYADANQVNAQIPYGLSSGPQQVLLTSITGTLVQSTVQIVDAAPGLFLIGATGHLAAQNQDFTTNLPASPATPGAAVIVYFTGPGKVDQAVTTGSGSPGNPVARVVATTTATIGGTPATVLFSGLTPGTVGLAQANITVPAKRADGTAWTPGDYPLVLTIGGIQTAPGNISIGK